MSSDEQLRVYRSQVEELKALVRSLEEENEALKRKLAVATLPAAQSDRYSQENDVLNRPAELVVRNTHIANEDRSNRQTHHSPPQQLGELAFVIETPQSLPSRKTLKEEDLVAAAPKSEDEWLKRREHLGLSSERSVIETFQHFISCSKPSIVHTAGIRGSSSDAQALVKTYETFVLGLFKDRDRSTQVANFALLLHTCLCRIASKVKNVSVDTVDNSLNLFLPQRKKQKGSIYLRRLRGSVRWPVSRAQEMRPWLGNRADEYFLLYGGEIETYRKLWDEWTSTKKDISEDASEDDSEEISEVTTLENTSEFVQKMKKACKLEDKGNDCIISFSVPFLVSLIRYGTFSLDDINEGLGAGLRKEEFDASVFTVFSKVQCILGIPHLSDQRQHESTGSDVITVLFSLSNALAKAPEETDREHVSQAGPAQMTSQGRPGQTFTAVNVSWSKTTSKPSQSDNGEAGKKRRKASKPAEATKKRPRRGAIRTSLSRTESHAALARTGDEGGSQAHTPNADGSADGHRPTTGTQTPNITNDTRRQLEPAEYRPGSGQPVEDHDRRFPDAVASADTGQDTRPQPSAFTVQQSEHTSLPGCSTQMPPGTINLAAIHPLQTEPDGHSLLQFDAGNNNGVVDLELMFGRPYDNHPNLTGFQPDNPQGVVDLEVMFGGRWMMVTSLDLTLEKITTRKVRTCWE
ncbi:hypothetical protein B0T25DRAFT_562902 [Lasiosphaeria hispida]|uniref:Uncharacterized protein n=1 Tax=Lasiosphaeria hispida TaxID=260671 RepID=A0AAJ0HWE0_9PEZI|nr:hypothetical protein B0T25DRAFT_562902 [Lasiosphaeria hispida]